MKSGFTLFVCLIWNTLIMTSGNELIVIIICCLQFINTS
jgi:hypothetical protein